MAKQKTLTAEEKLALVPSSVFDNLEEKLQKQLSNRKIKVHSYRHSADYGGKENVYSYVVQVVVNK